MMLLGLPNPFLWGTVAAVLNFIPYVGSATTLLVLSVVALVSFDSVGRIAAVMASYLALATIEGQIVQPLFVGQRLESIRCWCFWRCGLAAGCGASPASRLRCRAWWPESGRRTQQLAASRWSSF